MLQQCDCDCPFVYATCKHRVERWKGQVCLIKSQSLHEHTTSELGEAFDVTRQWIHQTLEKVTPLIVAGSSDIDVKNTIIDVMETESGKDIMVWRCPHCDAYNRNTGDCGTEDCDTHLEISLPGPLRSVL